MKKAMINVVLNKALSLKRPHKTETNRAFTEWLANCLPEYLAERAFMDEVGNLHVDARVTIDNRTLFVAHVDTVHREEGKNNIRKTDTHWYADGAPLGADDGAGVALLMHLIHAKVRAYYIFTQGEECGGIGAKHIADHWGNLLAEFDRAIAFDRRGTDSVITHQGYGRCCSDTFAQALADDLNVDDRLMYLPDDTGVYTDTAEFTDIIPECTNISVGYLSEHTQNESLNMIHYQTLASRVVNMDWDTLPTDRDPTIVESKWDTWGKTDYVGAWSGHGAGFSNHAFYDDDMAMYDLQDAIMEAQEGRPDWLMDMMAESIYPEDTNMAVKFIDKRKLTHDILQDALTMAWYADPDQVLAGLFDSAHATV